MLLRIYWIREKLIYCWQLLTHSLYQLNVEIICPYKCYSLFRCPKLARSINQHYCFNIKDSEMAVKAFYRDLIKLLKDLIAQRLWGTTAVRNWVQLYRGICLHPDPPSPTLLDEEAEKEILINQFQTASMAVSEM